jgi:hypothetical protein
LLRKDKKEEYRSEFFFAGGTYPHEGGAGRIESEKRSPGTGVAQFAVATALVAAIATTRQLEQPETRQQLQTRREQHQEKARSRAPTEPHT